MKPDTAALAERFERVRDRPGTLELFDALVVEDAPAVAAALGRHLGHPLVRELSAWLAERGVDAPRAPSAEEVLARHGIDDLEARLTADQREAARLREALERAFARAARAEALADGYAAVLLLAFALAAVGWAAALGLVPIFAPPQPEVPHVGDPPPTAPEP